MLTTCATTSPPCAATWLALAASERWARARPAAPGWIVPLGLVAGIGLGIAVDAPWAQLARVLPVVTGVAIALFLPASLRGEARGRSGLLLALFALGLLGKLGLHPQIQHYGFALAAPATLLVVVGLIAFPTISGGLIAALAFGGLTFLEGHFVTPMIIGRRLALNALAVLLASGWHRTLIPPPGGTKLADGGRLLWTGAIVAFWVLSLPLWHQLGARVTGEGISYYVYLRSAVFDGDLDFTNEYEAFNLDDANPRLLSPTPTGVSRNVHAVGPAVVWSPFLAVGRVLQGLSSGSIELTPFGTERPTREALDQETFGRGYAHVFVAAAPIGSITLLGLASVLWYREVARLLPPRDAAVGVVAAIVAGPLLWYTFFEPSMSHAPTAACLVFAMVAWRVWARYPSAGRALLVGLTAGLLAMQRWQFILWVVVPMGHLLYLAVRRDRPVPGVGESGAAGSGGSSAVKPPSPVCMTTPLAAGHLGLIMLGTLIALAPQFLAWKLVWGSWVVNPTGGGVDFIRLSWSEPKMLSVMWSQRHGLFTWHPVLLLAVIGFVPAWKRDRLLTGVCLGLLLAMIYVNAAVADWWGSDSFGQRRFAGLYPFFAWGLSAALASVRSARWRRTPVGSAPAGHPAGPSTPGPCPPSPSPGWYPPPARPHRP